MALKIIGAGFGRTGTLSLYTALNRPGFPCYHMFEVLENTANTSHLDFGRKIANTPAGTQHGWSEVFADYTASVDDPENAIAHYNQHIEDVKAAVPPGRLLIFSADQGWGPLCKFLERPVPEEAFPNINDRAAIEQTLKGMTHGAYAILGIGTLVVAGLFYAAIALFQSYARGKNRPLPRRGVWPPGELPADLGDPPMADAAVNSHPTDIFSGDARCVVDYSFTYWTAKSRGCRPADA